MTEMPPVEETAYSAEKAELEAAIEGVLSSSSRKKLIIAGPGTGKTTLFKQLLDRAGGDRDKQIVLTFINNLKDDLEKVLGALAQVYTLHSFCLGMLHRYAEFRGTLSEKFRCCPGLSSLIADDYELIERKAAPP